MQKIVTTKEKYSRKISGSKSSRIKIRSVLVYPSVQITQTTLLDPKGSLFFYFTQIKRQLIDNKLLADTSPLFVCQTQNSSRTFIVSLADFTINIILILNDQKKIVFFYLEIMRPLKNSRLLTNRESIYNE